MIKLIFHSALLGTITVLGVSPVAADELKSSPEYIRNLNEALGAKEDIWGEKLLQDPQGPTYENIKDLVHPQLFGGCATGWLTPSKVHYLPFGRNDDTYYGGTHFNLTVADGSQIFSDKVESGKTVMFTVGAEATEKYGSDLTRLSIALHKGYLPILETEYVDAQGSRYQQESFAAFIPETKTLASFIKFTVRPDAKAPAKIRAKLNGRGLVASDNRLISGNATHLIFSQGGTYENSDLTYTFDAASKDPLEVYLIWLNNPGTVRPLTADANLYKTAKESLINTWESRLKEGRILFVPEEVVMNAQKNLLIQNDMLRFRYSIGNTYETFFNAECSDSIQALAYYGFTDAYKDCIGNLAAGATANWEKAMRMKHTAFYYLLTKDESLVSRVQAHLERYAKEFDAQIKENPDGLLRKEAGGTDISDSSLFYSMHFQADSWRGLRDMSTIWNKVGKQELGKNARATADALKDSLRKAIDRSKVSLPDGSLFIPVTLLEERARVPFDPITATVKGTYWVLIALNGMSSGFFEPNAPETKQILSYLYNHGALFLGMLRLNYKGTPGLPGLRTQGTDNVYAVSLIKMLSDNDQADRLVLSFYGKLAHGMTRNTFTSGEGEEIAVHGIEYYRSMYLPPNTTNNAMFLFTLRLMLIRESMDEDGIPTDLHLAAATPRAWLEDGKQIRVDGSPTLFGPLSYTIDSHLAKGYIDATFDIPNRDPIRKAQLRLRTPGKREITKVELDGTNYQKFNSTDESIILPSKTGKLTLRVHYH